LSRAAGSRLAVVAYDPSYSIIASSLPERSGMACRARSAHRAAGKPGPGTSSISCAASTGAPSETSAAMTGVLSCFSAEESHRPGAQVLVAPLPQRVQRREQVGTLLGEVVLVPRWAFLVEHALEDALFDEPVEAVGEHVSRDSQALLTTDELSRDISAGISAGATGGDSQLLPLLGRSKSTETRSSTGASATSGQTRRRLSASSTSAATSTAGTRRWSTGSPRIAK